MVRNTIEQKLGIKKIIYACKIKSLLYAIETSPIKEQVIYIRDLADLLFDKQCIRLQRCRHLFPRIFKLLEKKHLYVQIVSMASHTCQENDYIRLLLYRANFHKHLNFYVILQDRVCYVW
jgi:hypothetical protein